MPRVQNMAITANNITVVHSHSNTFSLNEMTNCPMISGRAAINIITAIIGNELTPLMTAIQYRA